MGIVLLNSCEKVEKIGPNNFTSKTNWSVTEISIGGDLLTTLPKWEISTSTSSEWCHEGGTCAKFYWNFSQNNHYFEFNLDKNDPDNKVNAAYKQCDNLAGKYSVMTSKKSIFEFETNETNGYVGPRVYIKIE